LAAYLGIIEARISLPLARISRSAFAPYGRVVQVDGAGMLVNDGTARRYDVHTFPGSKVESSLSLVTSIFKADGLTLPRPIRMLERHPRTAQLIVPITAIAYVIVVSLSRSDGAPDLRTLRAFRLGEDEGVVYRPLVWHHPIIALDRKSLFLVQSWQDGTDRDCEITSIDTVLVSTGLETDHEDT
jgi:ureidoglycolate lyase